METLFFAAAAIICAVQAVRAQRLLHAALWLAGVSAMTSLLIYGLGARQAAVIELSVGAGLVFILFVFAISLAGEARPTGGSIVPRSMAFVLIGLVVLLAGELVWPRVPAQISGPIAPLSASLWADRQLDVLLQIVLIFTGAVTIAGLLAPTLTASTAATQATAAGHPAPHLMFRTVSGASALVSRPPVSEADHAPAQAHS